MSLAACYRLVMFLFMLPSMSLAMRVISTDQDLLLPREGGQAEIVSSSLSQYSSFTICARVFTFQFPKDKARLTQPLLSIGDVELTSSYVAWQCDHMSGGCTEFFKTQIGKGWKRLEQSLHHRE